MKLNYKMNCISSTFTVNFDVHRMLTQSSAIIRTDN